VLLLTALNRDNYYTVTWAPGWALLGIALVTRTGEDGGLAVVCLAIGILLLGVATPILLYWRSAAGRSRLALCVLLATWCLALWFSVTADWPCDMDEAFSAFIRIGLAWSLIGLVTASVLAPSVPHLSTWWRVLYCLIVSPLWALIGAIGALVNGFFWYVLILGLDLVGLSYQFWGRRAAPLVAGSLLGWAIARLCVLVLDAPFMFENKPYLPQSGTSNS